MPVIERKPGRKRQILKLQEHPGIHWPPGVEPNPPWVGPTSEFPDPLRITLSEVELVPPDKHAPRHLRLTGTYEGNLYRTSLGVDDAGLLVSLFELLTKLVGLTMGVIGSQLVDRALRPMVAGSAA